jgi:hypothetical protein
MKKYAILFLILSLLFALCACGANAPAADSGGQDAPAAGSEASATDSGIETAPESDFVPAEISVEIETLSEDAAQIAHIIAKEADGSVRWTYDTEKVYVGQVETLQFIGIGPGGLWFLAGGSLRCLSLDEGTEGTLLWQNDDFGGQGACWCWDDRERLYLCGYFGPSLMVVAADGSTVARYESLEGDDTFYWPYGISWIDEKRVQIDYDSNMGYRIVDAADGSVSAMSDGSEGGEAEPRVPDTRHGVGQMLKGTWGNDPVSPDFTIVLGEGEFFAHRTDGNAQTYYYTGTWYLGDWNAEDDWLLLPLDRASDDPAMGGLMTLGDYQISFETVEGELQMSLQQVNNGDSICSMVYDSYSMRLYKISEDSAMG